MGHGLFRTAVQTFARERAGVEPAAFGLIIHAHLVCAAPLHMTRIALRQDAIAVWEQETGASAELLTAAATIPGSTRRQDSAHPAVRQTLQTMPAAAQTRTASIHPHAMPMELLTEGLLAIPVPGPPPQLPQPLLQRRPSCPQCSPA